MALNWMRAYPGRIGSPRRPASGDLPHPEVIEHVGPAVVPVVAIEPLGPARGSPLRESRAEPRRASPESAPAPRKPPHDRSLPSISVSRGGGRSLSDFEG